MTEQATISPLNTYAHCKVEGEKLVNEYRQRGLVTAILRFSSVYGSAYDHADRVIPAFCRAAVKGSQMQIEGLENSFDFTHVSDVVNGIICTMNKLQAGVEDLPPIHLTTGKGTSLMQVVRLVRDILEQPVYYQEAPVRTYDVHRFCGNPDQAKKVLGWQAQVPFARGMEHLLKQYQHYFSLHDRAGIL